MPRVIYTPRVLETEVSLELVTSTKGTEYLYRLYGNDGARCTVHKLTPMTGRDPVSIMAAHAYTVHRMDHAPLAGCNCPWMTNHPDSRCKHANLCVAVWAHWDALRQLYVGYGNAPLSLPYVFAWKQGDPPLKIERAA